MKAITELINEHHGIRLMLEIMSAIRDRINQGENVDIQHLNDIVEFLSGFADKCHHGKEESILFKAMSPTGNRIFSAKLPSLLAEHAQGRSIIAGMRDILRNSAEPSEEALKALSLAFNKYVELLNTHIDTENNILFPALEADISPSLDEELGEEFEKLEAEVIGIGKHEAYHAMLEHFAEIYLKK